MASPDPKLLNEIGAYLANKRGLILDTSSTSRPAIRKILSSFGMKSNNIEIVESFKDAEEKINSLKPEVVFCEYELQKQTGIDLFNIFKKVQQNRMTSTFILMSDKNSPAIASQAADEDTDALIIRPFTFDDLQKNFIDVLIQKIKPSKYNEVIESGKVLYAENKFQEALVTFTKAKSLDPKPALACYYIAKSYIGLNEYEKAEKTFHEGLNLLSNHYKCLTGVFELLIESKKNIDAYKTGKILFEKYPTNPKYIPKMIWLTIYNKKYEEILDLCETIQTLENPDSTLCSNIAAALVICGKSFLMNNNKADAIIAFQKAEKAAKGKSKIIKEIIINLLNAEMTKEAQEFISRAPDDVKSSNEVLLGEFLYLVKQGTSTNILQQAQNLLKQGLKDYPIFEQALKCSVELKRSNAVIEDLLSNATQAHPSKKEHLESLIKLK